MSGEEHDRQPERKRAPDYFDDSDVHGDVKGKLVAGSTITVTASIIRFLLNFGFMVLLARLLDPEAYGLLAMAFVVTSFITLFQDMNLSLATVQRKEISQAQISTIYWINIAMSVVVALAILAAAPGVAWFYDESRLTAITAMLCLAVLFRGIGSQHKALLRRKMRFGAIAAIDILSMLAGYLVAVGLAWKGYGYWALVWLQIAAAAANTALSWAYSGWRPGRPVRGSGVRSMLLFGGNLTGFTLLRYPAKNLDRALIGWQGGAVPLGIYSKGFDLLGPLTGYVGSTISTVAVSALSRLVETPTDYRSVFRKLVEAIALGSLPLAVVIICTADDIVAVVLGSKWLDVGPILAILGILVFVEAMASGLQWLFISQGRGGHLLQYGVMESVLRIGAILVGLAWGIEGIAIAIAAVSLLGRLPVQIWYACRAGPVRSIDIYKSIFPVVVASVITLAAIVLIRDQFPSDNHIVGIAQSIVVAGCAVVAILLLTPSGREMSGQLRRGISRVVRRR